MNATYKYLVEKVRPVLAQMDMHSIEVEILMLMLVLHESMGLTYRRQQGGGPALSYFQIEPATLWDIVDRYLERRQDLRLKVFRYAPNARTREEILYELEHNDEFAIAVARIKLWMVPAALPDATDLDGLAQYAKDHWNTELGKATAQKYFDDFMRHLPAPTPTEWKMIEALGGDHV